MKYIFLPGIAIAALAAALFACNHTPEVQMDKGTVSHAGSPHILARSSGYLKEVVYYEPDPFAVNMSSVSYKNGKASIDSIIIRSDANKKQLIAALDYEKLEEKQTVAAIPAFIRTFLDSISGNGKFDMVDKGEKFQDDWLTLGQDLPSRQLIYFANGTHTALFSFYSGGARKTQHIAILKFYDEKVVDFWFESDVNAGTTKEAILSDLRKKRNKSGNC